MGPVPRRRRLLHREEGATLNATRGQLVDDYLARLDAALADLPRDRRREIVEEISGHIAEAEADLPPGDEAAVLELLDRIGDPEEIAAEARDRVGVPPPERRWVETAAIVLLLVGGFVAGVGWLVGVILLWGSNVWTTRDKLIGTLVVPGGLAFGVLVGGFVLASATSGGCSSGPGSPQPICTNTGGTPLYQQILLGVFLVAVLVGPILTAAYLARRMRRPAVEPL